jgi:iron complex transport system permease protein
MLYTLVGRDGSLLSLILAGVALNSLAAALTALVLNLAPNPYAVFEIVFWLMGSLADRSFEHVWLALPLMLIGWILLLSSGRGLDALTLGEDVASSLGISVSGLRARIVAGSALAVGAAVSVSGVIGFIGLVVPHLLRPLVGSRPHVLLPMSALGGAALTLAADIIVRRIGTATELKLGVVTALVGAPFFLYLVVRSRRHWQ